MHKPLAGILLLTAAMSLSSAALATDSRACALLTVAELEPVVGSKLSIFQGSTYPTGDMCTASSGTATVTLRLGTKEQADASAKSLDMIRTMGGTVKVKTFGAITCLTVTPAKDMQQYGFKTTCSVNKAAKVAAVEVRVRNQKDMVSIDKLRLLADKMTGRF